MKVRRLLVLDILKKYNKKDRHETRILDFGCGSGYFVGELAEIGYESFGLDNSAEAIEFGRSRGVKNLAITDGRKIGFPDNYFDCVLLLDVIEHLDNESWAIKEVERVLVPGGITVIMAPAFMFLWGVQDEVSRHYRRYNMPQLVNVVKQNSNFGMIFKSYFNTILFLPIAITRIISRWFHIKSRTSDFDINNRFLNKILFHIFNFERYLLQHLRLPFGVSILAVFRKNKNL